MTTKDEEPRMTLADLAATIRIRAQAPATESYTASLVEKGKDHCARKMGEEAIEVIVAAVQGDRAALISESADLIYHWLLLLEASEVDVEAVMAALAARTKRSGHEEKKSRTPS